MGVRRKETQLTHIPNNRYLNTMMSMKMMIVCAIILVSTAFALPGTLQGEDRGHNQNLNLEQVKKLHEGEDRRRRDNRKSPCTLLSCEYQEGEDRGPTALQEEDRRRRDNRKSTCNCNRMSVCKRQNGKWGCVSMFS